MELVRHRDGEVEKRSSFGESSLCSHGFWHVEREEYESIYIWILWPLSVCLSAFCISDPAHGLNHLRYLISFHRYSDPFSSCGHINIIPIMNRTGTISTIGSTRIGIAVNEWRNIENYSIRNQFMRWWIKGINNSNQEAWINRWISQIHSKLLQSSRRFQAHLQGLFKCKISS